MVPGFAQGTSRGCCSAIFRTRPGRAAATTRSLAAGGRITRLPRRLPDSCRCQGFPCHGRVRGPPRLRRLLSGHVGPQAQRRLLGEVGRRVQRRPPRQIGGLVRAGGLPVAGRPRRGIGPRATTRRGCAGSALRHGGRLSGSRGVLALTRGVGSQPRTERSSARLRPPVPLPRVFRDGVVTRDWKWRDLYRSRGRRCPSLVSCRSLARWRQAPCMRDARPVCLRASVQPSVYIGSPSLPGRELPLYPSV